jgi:putative peptidoglycan lipid II flippase
MAAGTALSRLSGFARLLAVGWVLGQQHLADAYNGANTVPNIIYELLLGGVLSATLLPVLMGLLNPADGSADDDGVPAVVSFLTVVLLAATAAFWLLAPTIIHFYLSGVTGSGAGAERQLATTWLRLFAPQLLFIGLITITTALLNARRRFGSVAFSPILANVVTIASLIVADRMVPHSSVDAYRADAAAVAVVGIGTTAGYLAQLLAQLPALWRSQVSLRPLWRPRHAALRTIARLSGWTIGSVGANQVSFLFVTVLALRTGGSFSAFSYAYAFMLLPHAVVAVSIAYVVAPDLAELWSNGDGMGFASRVSNAVRVTLVLLVPGGVGYALVARPVVVLALAHGHLASGSASLTGSLLVIFALGLPGFSTYLLLMRAFQSKQDTRSMFWLYVLENCLTVGAALALYSPLGLRGLVVAWIGSYSVTLPFAWWRLRGSAPVSIAGGWCARTLGATAVMAGVAAGTLRLLPAAHSVPLSAGRVVAVVAVGAGAFMVAARVLGISELSGLWARFRRASG